MKRIRAGAGVVIVALSLLTAPAAAQNGSAWFVSEKAEAFESSGQIVVTVSMWRPGRVTYQTFDGPCQVSYSRGGTPPQTVCSEDGRASAPEDYAATSGELVFTEEGSRTITIPIADDDRREPAESFTVAAWEEVNADPWIDRGDSTIVRIVDDDSPRTATPSETSPGGGGPSGSAAEVTAPPAAAGSGVTTDANAPESETRPSPDLQIGLAGGDLHSGPGFQLASEQAPQPAVERDGGGSPAGWLGAGLGVAAVGVGVLAFVQRRRRWSPTRA